MRRLAIRVKVLKPLIASIAQDLTEFIKHDVRAFEEFEVMLPSFANEDIQDFLAFFINHDLRFQGMAFFLTREVPTLFFLGRSIGVSATSIMTISQ